jgi:hypothetical protein
MLWSSMCVHTGSKQPGKFAFVTNTWRCATKGSPINTQSASLAACMIRKQRARTPLRSVNTYNLLERPDEKGRHAA